MNVQLITDVLSFITITLCTILKIPQMLNIMAVKSAKEISMIGLMLELISYTVMTSYNYTNGYSLSSYLEYPFILIQEYILIYLVLKYLNRINILTMLAVACYFTFTFSLLMQLVPKYILTILASISTPISASSKIVQLLVILRAKNSESVSLLTWLISALSNLTRIFTVWVDSADILLLGNFIISTILSTSVMFLAMYYKPCTKIE